MDRHDILAALRRAGSGVAGVAADLDLSEGHVSHVIAGRYLASPVARHIAQVTGIPVSRLWPGRYDNSRKAA